MRDLPPGWLTDDEADALAEMARDKRVLEIGSYLGRSTVAMARTAQLVVAVDHHRGSLEDRPGNDASKLAPPGLTPGALDTSYQFLAHLDRYCVRERVVAIVGRSQDVLPLLALTRFGFAFVDGSHDYGSALEDLWAVAEIIPVGGLIAVHDYDVCPGVQRAVVEIQARLGWRIDLPAGSLAVLKS